MSSYLQGKSICVLTLLCILQSSVSGQWDALIWIRVSKRNSKGYGVMFSEDMLRTLYGCMCGDAQDCLIHYSIIDHTPFVKVTEVVPSALKDMTVMPIYQCKKNLTNFSSICSLRNETVLSEKYIHTQTFRLNNPDCQSRYVTLVWFLKDETLMINAKIPDLEFCDSGFDCFSTESSTTVSSTIDAFTTESSTTDAFTTESSTIDASTTEASTSDASTTEASTIDASTTEASTIDASKTEASTIDASKTEASTTEASTIDASKTEASTIDASKTEASTIDASTTESSTTKPSVISNKRGDNVDNAGVIAGATVAIFVVVIVVVVAVWWKRQKNKRTEEPGSQIIDSQLPGSLALTHVNTAADPPTNANYNSVSSETAQASTRELSSIATASVPQNDYSKC